MGLFSCQTESQKIFDVDIKGDFKKLTTIKLRIKKDSLGNEFKDTIFVIYSYFDKKKRTDKMITKFYIRNQVTQIMKTKFKYNYKGQIRKEVAQMDKDSTEFEVNYFYKDNKVSEIKSVNKYVDNTVGLNEKYTYSPNGKITERNFKQYTLDLTDNDTTSLDIVKFKYDNNEKQIESDWSNKFSDYSNFKEYYSYNENDLLIKTIKYDKLTGEKDSTMYRYKYDSLNNWIYRESIKNDLIIQITKRIIE